MTDFTRVTYMIQSDDFVEIEVGVFGPDAPDEEYTVTISTSDFDLSLAESDWLRAVSTIERGLDFLRQQGTSK